MKIFYFQANLYLQRLALLKLSVSHNYLSIMTLIPIDNKHFLSYLSHVQLFPLIFSALRYHNYHQILPTQTDSCGPLESTGTGFDMRKTLMTTSIFTQPHVSRESGTVSASARTWQ